MRAGEGDDRRMYSGMGFVEKTREGRKKSRIMMKSSLRPHLDLRAGMHPGRAVLGPVVRLVLVDLDLDLGRLGRLGRGGAGPTGDARRKSRDLIRLLLPIGSQI